jgi:hypothetical protein
MMRLAFAVLGLLWGMAAQPAQADGKRQCKGDVNVLFGSLDNGEKRLRLHPGQCLCFGTAQFRLANITDKVNWRVTAMSRPGVRPVMRGICPQPNAKETMVSLADPNGMLYFVTVKTDRASVADRDHLLKTGDLVAAK